MIKGYLFYGTKDKFNDEFRRMASLYGAKDKTEFSIELGKRIVRPACYNHKTLAPALRDGDIVVKPAGRKKGNIYFVFEFKNRGLFDAFAASAASQNLSLLAEIK